jgi:hypothetical protein
MVAVDAHRRVVHGVLQVGEDFQSSEAVARGVCRCRWCEQQLVPILVISLSRKMDRYMVGLCWIHRSIQHVYNTASIEGMHKSIIKQPLYASSLSSS